MRCSDNSALSLTLNWSRDRLWVLQTTPELAQAHLIVPSKLHIILSFFAISSCCVILCLLSSFVLAHFRSCCCHLFVLLYILNDFLRLHHLLCPCLQHRFLCTGFSASLDHCLTRCAVTCFRVPLVLSSLSSLLVICSLAPFI